MLSSPVKNIAINKITQQVREEDEHSHPQSCVKNYQLGAVWNDIVTRVKLHESSKDSLIGYRQIMAKNTHKM